MRHDQSYDIMCQYGNCDAVFRSKSKHAKWCGKHRLLMKNQKSREGMRLKAKEELKKAKVCAELGCEEVFYSTNKTRQYCAVHSEARKGNRKKGPRPHGPTRLDGRYAHLPDDTRRAGRVVAAMGMMQLPTNKFLQVVEDTLKGKVRLV